MRQRRALILALLAGGCHRDPAPGDLPPAGAAARPGAEAVDGAPSPVAGARVIPRAGTPRRTQNPPLTPDEGSMVVEPPGAAQPGVAATARVRVTANRGYEINEQYHYKLTLDTTPGVTLARTVLSEAEHLDSHELAIVMTLTAERPGDYTVHGKLDFAVCKTGSQCLAKTMPVAVLVAVR